MSVKLASVRAAAEHRPMPIDIHMIRSLIMGYFYYGNNSYAVQIDDRALAHLKIAILSLLRAGKSMAFCFDRSADLGSGREALWISPSTEIRFVFLGSRPPRINHEWLRDIVETANTATGLRLVREPQESTLLARVAG